MGKKDSRAEDMRRLRERRKFGKRVTQYRKLNNLSVEELASKFGIKTDMLIRIENGTFYLLDDFSDVKKKLIKFTETLPKDVELPESLSDSIYELRTALNIYQKALGESIGVSRQTICDWENGKAIPLNEQIGKLENFFGIRKGSLRRQWERAMEEKNEKQI
jgi:DNA-binding helix-turn-helix protein